MSEGGVVSPVCSCFGVFTGTEAVACSLWVGFCSVFSVSFVWTGIPRMWAFAYLTWLRFLNTIPLLLTSCLGIRKKRGREARVKLAG